MGKHRSRLDIIAAMLNVASGGVKKTRIMHLANLSYALLEKYLKETMSFGFMDFDGEGYRVTEKGRAFLDKYSRYNSRHSKAQKTLRDLTVEWKDLEKMCEKTPEG